ncbi:MAG: DUF4124 domain-containing protein [Nitrososphaera sp.]|nr:DUF4124 domain-containing protein [Nitrososphaera sp.]
MWNEIHQKPKGLQLLLVSFLVVVTAGADVYKWVDDKGVTHYSETPPPGRKAQPVEMSPRIPEKATQEAQEKLQRFLREQQRREDIQKEQNEEQRQQKVAKQGEQAEKRQRCLKAKQQLGLLEQQRPAYRVNERCEWVFLDDSARLAEIERFKREIEANCEKGKDEAPKRGAIPPDKKRLEKQIAAVEERAKQEFCRCAPFRLQDMEKPAARTATSELESYKREIETKCK